MSTVVVRRANGSSINLGNLRSIINISRLFNQSDLEDRIMLLLDNGASEFLRMSVSGDFDLTRVNELDYSSTKTDQN